MQLFSMKNIFAPYPVKQSSGNSSSCTFADVPVQLPDECGEDYQASLVGFDLVLRQQLGVS